LVGDYILRWLFCLHVNVLINVLLTSYSESV